jgi:hypothetical protein
MGLPGACTVVPVDLPASRVPPSPAFLSAHGFINVGSSNFRKISLRGHPVATALPQCGCEISIGWSFSALWERLNRICSLIRLFEIRCQRNSPSRNGVPDQRPRNEQLLPGKSDERLPDEGRK